MQITPASLDSIYKGFNTIFTSALMGAQSNATKLAMHRTSGTRSEVYAAMSLIPRMREWVGERQFHSLASRTYELKNREFELSVKVSRNDIEDDQLGVYTETLMMMGFQTGRLVPDLIIEALKAGGAATSKCLDGASFFSNAHPIDPDTGTGSQSNSYSLALSDTNYDAVRTGMGKLQGADSRSLLIRPTHLIVPPALETTAKKIVVATELAGAGTNVQAGTTEILVLQELTSDTEWYLADLSKPFKPFVSQMRRAPALSRSDTPGAPSVFRRSEFEYGTDARAAAGYGLWQLIARGNA